MPEMREGTSLTGHVTDNFVIMGYQIGNWVAENYPGSKGVFIPGFLGQGPAEGEIVGTELALAENNMPELFFTKSSEWQRTLAIPITQDLVASGRDFDVVYACNEETAAGIIQVFEEMNVKDKIIVSFNGKEEGWGKRWSSIHCKSLRSLVIKACQSTRKLTMSAAYDYIAN